ncbi:MAG: LptF/LptG family permease, partial [Planctomycetaceae bacterium]|nr:LptF/LptG family permease [Planctomycetaceae bacterium]
MILERYIFRELLASFVFAFLCVLVVCLVGTMFQVFRTFPGLGFAILAQALPLATGAMATWVMLVASSTSSTLVYARLAAENEITAMRACGIHTWRILAPALLLGLLLVGAAYPLNEIVVPWTRHARRLAFRQSTLEALRMPPPGTQDFTFGSYRIHYTDYRDGRMIEPTIAKMKNGTVVMDYFAPSGQILSVTDPIKLLMSQPSYWRLTERGQREDFRASSDVTVEIPLQEFDNAQPQMQDWPAWRLWEELTRTKERARRNPILLILHTRYALSLAPLMLVLVAVPIGIL